MRMDALAFQKDAFANIGELVRRPLFAAAAIFIVLFSFTFLAWSRFSQSITDRNRVRFQAQALDLEEPIVARLNLYAEALLAGKGFFLGSAHIERVEWREFVANLDIKHRVPGMLGIGFAERIDIASSIPVGTKLLSRTDPSVSTKTLEDRHSYAPIVYIEPSNDINDLLIDYDILSSPVREDSIRKADATGSLQMTGPLDLGAGRTSAPIPGFIIYVPLFSASSTGSNMQGYIFGRFPYETVTADVADTAERDGIDIHIYDSDEAQTDAAQLVYESARHGEQATLKSKYHMQDSVTMFGRTWTFKFDSLPTYEIAESGGVLTYAILAEGFLISTFAAFLIYVVMNRRERAEHIANDMTADLAESKAELEKRVIEAERMNKLMIARELKMVELKKRVNISSPKFIPDVSASVPVSRLTPLSVSPLFAVQKIPATIAARRVVAEGAIEVVFALSHPMPFHTGQYVTVTIPSLPSEQGVHDFSICSSAQEPDRIAIVFRESDSTFKKWMHSAPDGAEVRIDGPKGNLVLPEDTKRPIICLGGGVGISPFVSFASTIRATGESRDITILALNATPARAPYLDVLQKISAETPSIRYVSVIGEVERSKLDTYAKNAPSALWYVAGPPPMVEVAKRTLTEIGVLPENIREEHFTGYES